MSMIIHSLYLELGLDLSTDVGLQAIQPFVPLHCALGVDSVDQLQCLHSQDPDIDVSVENGPFHQQLQDAVVLDFLGLLPGQILQDLADDLQPGLNDSGVLLVDGGEFDAQLLLADLEGLVDCDGYVRGGVLEDCDQSFQRDLLCPHIHFRH